MPANTNATVPSLCTTVRVQSILLASDSFPLYSPASLAAGYLAFFFFPILILILILILTLRLRLCFLLSVNGADRHAGPFQRGRLSFWSAFVDLLGECGRSI